MIPILLFNADTTIKRSGKKFLNFSYVEIQIDVLWLTYS